MSEEESLPDDSDWHNDPDWVRAFAFLESELREARISALQRLGHTESTRRDVHDRALVQMGDTEHIATEFGTVQRIPAGHIQWRRLNSTEDRIWKQRLKLITKERM